jgi:predicted ATPase
MARLDRLSEVREVVQLGAVLGREFAYEILRKLTTLDDAALQARLAQLVGAELLYQRGRPPRARYVFKHALIQDAAYGSMLKSTRQRYHQQVAQSFAQHFPELVETQPEVVAHHYTEAGLTAQAIPYWQKAGQRAAQRSAYVEAIGHLTKGLELLKTLPDSPERIQQELDLQITLGPALMATKGYEALEVERVYTRAIELCRQVSEHPQLFLALGGLWQFYLVRAKYQTARELGGQLLNLAQSVQDPTFLLLAHRTLAEPLFLLGELAFARAHLEQGMALYNLQQHRSLAFLYGADPGAMCLNFAALTLWHLGYPDQALKRSYEALTLVQELSHSPSLAITLCLAAELHQFRRESQLAQERAEAAVMLSTEQGLPHQVAYGTILQGWVLTEQGQVEEGTARMHQGLSSFRARGAEVQRTYHFSLLAEAHSKVGQAEEGLAVLAEALAVVDKTGERFWEAELYRLKGELLRMGEREKGGKGEAIAHSPTPPFAPSSPEACFLKAIEIARRQQAKSLELRAVMSLVRLRQQQATQYVSRTTQHEARAMLDAARNTLSEIYGWFTEGFDTKDLQEAKALLNELS